MARFAHTISTMMAGGMTLLAALDMSRGVTGSTLVDDALAEQKGKYRLPDGFHKAHVVYNLHRAREHATNSLIIVEGFFGTMRVWQAGFPGVVALMGSSLSEHQEQLLAESTDRLTLLLDGDEAGRACRRDIWKRLSSRLWLRNIPLEDGQQPDDLPQDQLRQLLS